MKRKIYIGILGFLILAGSFSFYAFEDSNDFKIIKNMDVFYSLFRELNFWYVDETDPQKLIEDGINGMLESLDPYTTYIPESEMDDFKFMTTGQYGGIGALIRRNSDYTIISDPYQGFPADKAGLRAGDVILEIDGKSIKGQDVSKVSEQLKGSPGSELNLKIKRPGNEKPSQVKLIREKITISSVPYAEMVSDDIGYLRVTNFTSGVTADVKKAVLDLTKNRGAKKLIIDLRGNPGGLLNEAVDMTGLFVDKGQEIVATRGKVKQFDEVYRTTKETVNSQIPMAVLVNRGSASASEIFSGAIQDIDRGIIIGDRTFGKGLVQSTRPLSYNSQLKVTTAKYYIPSGRCIQALDYAHRNEDGSVGHIPDSLISEFKTKNGRKVYDGGGITPDYKISTDPYSKIAVSLYAKNLYFDFATEYVMMHTQAPDLKTFTIDDQIYGQFIEFLKDKEYDYKTQSSEKLDELITMAKRERYYKDAEDELNALQKKLAHDKTKDLQTFSSEIKDLLLEEIMGRYYYQQGKMAVSLRDDPQLEKAIELLNDSTIYTGILEGTKTFNDSTNVKVAFKSDEIE